MSRACGGRQEAAETYGLVTLRFFCGMRMRLQQENGEGVGEVGESGCWA